MATTLTNKQFRIIHYPSFSVVHYPYQAGPDNKPTSDEGHAAYACPRKEAEQWATALVSRGLERVE